MNKISKRRFVYCGYYQTDVPIEDSKGCCDFYNPTTGKCECDKYIHKTSKIRLSKRQDLYNSFSEEE
jgi:hypothetical protein